MASVKSQILKCNSLLHHEPPISLIGRYADLLGSRAEAQNQIRFNSWLDIDQVAISTLGVGIADLQSLLFTVYASIPNKAERRGSDTVARVFPFSEEENEQTLPFCFDPLSWFTNTPLLSDTIAKVLDLVSCSPAIRFAAQRKRQ